MQTFRLATLIKRDPKNRCFPVNIAKVLRTPNLKIISKRLLLDFLSVFVAFIYLFKFNNRNTRKKREIKKPKLTIKTPEQRHWLCYRVFIVNFKHLSHRFLVFQLLAALKKDLPSFNLKYVYQKIQIYKGGERLDILFCGNCLKHWSRWVKEIFEQRIK